MASPWNFLARLTRRRRDRDEKQESATGDVTPEEAKSAEPISDEAGNTQDPQDRPAEAKPQPPETVDTGIIKPEPAEAGNNVPAKAGRKRALPAGPSGDAPVVPASIKTPVGKKKRNKAYTAIKTVEAVPQPPESVPSFSDEVQSIEAEIGLLRHQLARKLQQQNAQLRTMLARFER
jgi:hypothetical protein